MSDSILKSRFPDVPIPDNVCLSQLILERMAGHGSAMAFTDGMTGRQISYAELRQTIFLVAGKLLERGIRKGKCFIVKQQQQQQQEQ